MRSSRRVQAPAVHAALSLTVAAFAAFMVFVFWYPPPFSTLANGTTLFLILVGVDMVIGPALTAVAANPIKPARVFRRDVAVIALLQAAALAYGIYSLAGARPVLLVFEVDRFRLLTANDIDKTLLPEAPPELRTLSWSGPKVIAAATPTSRAEFQRSLDLAMGGVDISYLPKNWRTYATYKEDAWRKAKPVADLLVKYPAQKEALAETASRAAQAVDALRFLPVIARRGDAVALVVAPDARLVGYLPVEGFF